MQPAESTKGCADPCFSVTVGMTTSYPRCPAKGGMATRALRRLAVHHHYEKTSKGPRLDVQAVGRGHYDKSRALGAYATAATNHLALLGLLLDQFETSTRKLMIDAKDRS